MASWKTSISNKRYKWSNECFSIVMLVFKGVYIYILYIYFFGMKNFSGKLHLPWGWPKEPGEYMAPRKKYPPYTSKPRTFVPFLPQKERIVLPNNRVFLLVSGMICKSRGFSSSFLALGGACFFLGWVVGDLKRAMLSLWGWLLTSG